MKYSLILVAIMLPLISLVVYFLHRKQFPVHSSGIVLITGASTGIGRHAAEYIARKHSGLIVLAGVRKDSDSTSISEMNIKNLQPITIDVSSHDSCVEAIEKIRSLSKDSGLPLVAVVNNAGISRTSPAEYHLVQDAKQVFDTNFFGVLDLVQLTIPLLRDSKGRIIMVSSLAGLIGRPLTSIYTASKFALEGLSDCLRREMIGFDISVSVIEPAYVKSAIFAKSMQKSLEILQDKIDQRTSEPAPLHYERFFSNSVAKKEAMIAKASDPIVTSIAIEDAIVSAYPKTRYAVANANGLPAVVAVWLSWLCPDRLEDYIMLKAF